MSETTVGTNGAALPSPDGASQPASGQSAPPGRLSISEAAAELGKRRREARAPRPNGAAPATNGAAAPAAAPHTQQTPQAASPEPAAVPVSDAGKGDPLAQLIEQLRPQPAAAGGEGAGASAQPGGDAITLTVDGAPRQFSQAQLLQHFHAAQHFTQRTQQLSQQAQQVSERAQIINDLLPVLVPELERQVASLERNLGSEPDWQALAAADPAEYQRQDALWKAAERERTRLQRLQQVQAVEQDRTRRQQLADGHRVLTEKLPGWADAGMRQTLQTELRKWGLANDFPQQELEQIYEPRHIVTLAKAMMFDRMMSGASTAAPIVPGTVGRGTPPAAPASQGVRAAEQIFSEKPNAANAARLLMARRQAAARRQ